jgi:hypothetical protein
MKDPAYYYIEETGEWPLYAGDLAARYGWEEDHDLPAGVVPVERSTPPVETPDRGWLQVAPVQIGKVWTQQFETVDYTAEQKDRAQARSSLEGICRTVGVTVADLRRMLEEVDATK